MDGVIMKRVLFMLITTTFWSCENISFTEQFAILSTSDEVPSVSMLNDPTNVIKVASDAVLPLGMKVEFPSDYKIHDASFRLAEGGINFNNDVIGGSTISETEFELDNTFNEQYNIYRGGEFEIRAEIDLLKIVDNTILTIHSEPVSFKILWPTQEEIEEKMKLTFKATWDSSKLDPGKREYGYCVFLKNRELKVGESQISVPILNKMLG